MRTLRFTWLAWLGETMAYWWPVGPILLLVLLIAWVASGSASRFQAGFPGAGFALFPWMRSLLANYETANFSELLGLLLEHRVPYPSAIVLAADSTGDARLSGAPGNWPKGLRGAKPPPRRWVHRPENVLAHDARWVLATGQEQGSLVAALGNLANVYRKRAQVSGR